ncbi:MAG: phage major capsid protein [Sphingopyxis macrogoltabida]|uniref:Phage major capsid protein n=1 Tax=Sphingopyxis macrogoltabida TaxID=33050 RepID=A0A2W5MTY2_SPHMC|nr:MAG: phage major capsid protein [Sphingopyxis macrogoltabida]
MNKIAKLLSEIRSRAPMRREATIGAVDIEARTVELSFSSETDTVERWFGIEILGHGEGEVDLSRLNNSAPLLWMHNWRDQRGVIEAARVDLSDMKGRAIVRLSKSEAGEQLLQDMADGIITKVSTGYDITGLKLVEERQGVDVYRASWAPYEISMVSVAADDTVGVGRSAEIPGEENDDATGEMGTRPELADATNRTKEGVAPMNIKIVRDGQGNLVRAKMNEDGTIAEVVEILEQAGENIRAATARGEETERSRVRSISSMGAEYGKPELAAEFVRDGKSAEDFQRAVLADFVAERAKGKTPLDDQPGDQLGMTDKEVRSYSLLRAVRALANPHDVAAQKDAAFEIECSVAAQRQYGKEAKGILIPADVLSNNRAFNAGGAANSPVGATSGSNIVATDLLAGSFIDMLRKRTTIMQLGRVMGGLVGNVEIPKQTGGATAYWVGEGGDATEGTPTLVQIALSPKTVGAYTDITRRLLSQSTPDAEALVVGDLRAAMSQEIDRAGFYGTGATNQPRGIKNYTGLNAVDFAAAGAPTFAELVKMESEIASDNAETDSMAYVFNAAMRGHCKTTPKFGAGTDATIWEPGNTVNGYRAEVTNQIASGDVFHGNFADLIIALWGGLDLTVDPYSLSKSGGLRLVVFQDVDFVLRRVESLCYGSDTVTP